MRKFIAILAILFCMQANAQKGVNKLVIGADLGIPMGDFENVASIGGGIMGKMVFGITPAGDITATTGVSFFPLKTDDLGLGGFDGFKGTWSVVPILVGYRHNFGGGLFLEPQLGMGVYALKAKYQGQSESDSETAFTWAAGFGYAKNKLEVGFRYQSGEKDGSLALFGLHVGYVLPLKGRR